jgi:hypothetical protein
MGSMHRPNIPRSFAGIWLLLMVVAALPGCHNGQGCPCNDITCGAIPQPNGTYACQWMRAEKARAAEDNFVVYQYEWSSNGKKLTPSGREHVAGIAQRLDQMPFPVVIEPSSDDRVNSARKAAVMEVLSNCGAQVSADRVIVGRPEAEGLYGAEAPGIARRMLTTRGSGQGAGGGLGLGSLGGGSQGTVGTSSSIGVGVGTGFY